VPLTLEVQNDVDQVLEQPRAGDRAVLGDVSDQDGRDAALLCDRDEGGAHRPDLRHATGAAIGLRTGYGLDAVDDQKPGLDGIDVVAALARQGPDVPVVLLSAFSDEPLVRAGLQSGAATYVDKSADRDEILRAVTAAATAALAPRALAGASDLQPGNRHHWIPRLTRMEFQLLQLARSDVDKLEMALRLGVDEPTVRRGLSSVIAKTGADTLPRALEIAIDAGLLQ